jgi:serine O-acetyltransferase
MQLALAVTVLDVVVIYLILPVVLIVAWLGSSLVVYALVRSPWQFDFKSDLLRKVEGKRSLPSGRRLSLLYVSTLLLGDNCIQAALFYRVSRWLAAHRLRRLAEAVYALSKFVTHIDISPWASVEPGLYLYHGLGTVIGKGSHVGKRALICHGVSIGGGAVLGDDVTVWAGAQVLKKMRIETGCEIGANSVVTNDVPAGSIVFGVPGRVVGRVPAFQPDQEPPAPSTSESSSTNSTVTPSV